ncbi:MAG: hypothetical protein AAB652_01835 [Patescibacteria group bacterium]
MARFKDRPFFQLLSFAFAFAALAFFVRAYAAVPQIINYQGRLEDASGNLQGSSAGTNFDFKFSIWSTSTVGLGTRLWPASAPASTTHKITSGVFDARIGDTNQGFSALNLDFNTSSIYYLQIEVYSTSTAAFETLTPRQSIVASGFAINADTVDGAHAGTSANNVLQLDPSGGINLPNGSSTFAGAVVFSNTLNVGGITTLSGITFTNATGTSLALTTVSSTNVSSTNITVFGYGTFPTLNSTNAALTNVSSTNISVTGYGTFPTLNFTNASGTNLTVSGYLQGAALNVSGQSTLAAVSSTNITASGYGIFPTMGFTNASGTNLTASGYLQGTSLNISGQSTLANVSSTNFTASGFLQGASLNISGASTLSTITGATTTLTGTLAANLAYLTSTSTIFGDTLTFTTNGADDSLQWSRSSSSQVFGRLNLKDASGTTILQLYPSYPSGSTQGAVVNGRLLIGKGSSLSGNQPNPNGTILAIGEDYSDTEGGWSNGIRLYATLDTDIGASAVITGGNYGLIFVDGFESTDGGGTGVAGTFTGHEVSISGNPNSSPLLGSFSSFSLFKGTGLTSIHASSAAWGTLRGLQLSGNLQTSPVKSMNAIGAQITPSYNATNTADLILGRAGTMFISNAANTANVGPKLTFGGAMGATDSLGFTKGGNFIAQGGSGTNVASSTLIFGINNTSTLRLSSTSLDTVPSFTNAFDLGTVGRIFRTGYFGTSLIVGSSTASSSVVVIASGTIAIATSTQFSATSTLTVCAKNNCTVPTAASTTDTVAFFASADGSTTANSIIARGSIYGGQADIGEFVQVVGPAEDYGAGDLLSISVAKPGKFEKSRVAYDQKLVGVVTETAGLVAGGGDDGRGSIIMALAGRLPVKVTGQNGPIEPGDYLTSSDTLGYAMKATNSGKVVAIAMEAFRGTSIADTGRVLAFMSPQWKTNVLGGSNLQGYVGYGQGGINTSIINNYNLDPLMAYSMRELTVEKLTIGSPETPVGFTIFDVQTKNPYCVQVEDGILKTLPGVCGSNSENAHNNDGETQGENPAGEDPISTSTSTSTSTPSSTPPVESPILHPSLRVVPEELPTEPGDIPQSPGEFSPAP